MQLSACSVLCPIGWAKQRGSHRYTHAHTYTRAPVAANFAAVLWVKAFGIDERVRHQKYFQHMSDPVLLQAVNEALAGAGVAPISVDKFRKIKNQMGYVLIFGHASAQFALYTSC